MGVEPLLAGFQQVAHRRFARNAGRGYFVGEIRGDRRGEEGVKRTAIREMRAAQALAWPLQEFF